jgi:selenocysteine lyase/cysteine desulfurase
MAGADDEARLREARLLEARQQFDAEVTYLNTATLGLPPRAAVEALSTVQREWRAGTADALAYDDPVAAARAAYAELVGVDAGCVAVGSQVSVFAGLVAASLPDGSEVLTAMGDFTSILFPFAAQASRGVKVRAVPLERVATEVSERTALVAVSAAQSADGRLADLDALETACFATGTRVLLDTTQSAGWLPVDASRFAYTVCGGYKWLLAARGTAYLTISPQLLDEIVPHTAGWYAGADRWSSIYGLPLRLAPDARRFDVSPAWHAWVSAAPALELLNRVGPATLHRHATGVANRFRAQVGASPAESAIVSLDVDPRAAEAMRTANIVGAMRAGRLRLSFHVMNGDDDADHAAEVLRPYILTG